MDNQNQALEAAINRVSTLNPADDELNSSSSDSSVSYEDDYYVDCPGE